MKTEPKVPHFTVGYGKCDGPFERTAAGRYRCTNCGVQSSSYEYYQMRRDAQERQARRSREGK